MTPPLTAAWDWRRRLVYGVVGLGFLIVLALPAVDFDGVTVERRGDEVDYRLSWVWAPVVAVPPVLMGLLAVAGLTLPTREGRFAGGVFLFFAVAIAVAAVPGVFVGGLTVRPDGFTHVAGGWWAPEARDVRFRDLESIAVRPGPGEAVPRSFVLECRRRDGAVVSLPRSTVLRAGLRRVVAAAAAAGVRVETKAERPD